MGINNGYLDEDLCNAYLEPNFIASSDNTVSDVQTVKGY